MQKKESPVWPWVLGVVVVVGAGGAWVLKDRLTGQADAPPVAASAAAAPPGASHPDPVTEPASAAETTVQHPVDTGLTADPALPNLADSDAPVWEALAAQFAGSSVLDLLLRDHLLQRWVTHVDNLDKPSLAPVAMAVKPLPGTLQVEAVNGIEQIAAGNASRYAPYVAAFAALDAEAVGRTYVRFYPLIQQVYAELGRKDAYFNDRLVAVIDHLLATPEPARPLQVERDARGRYRFVDPALQERSVGQKLLLRMDAAQVQAVKQQLRAIRRAITRG